MDEEVLIQETTDLILDTVHRVLDLADAPPRIVDSAVIVYECVNAEGRPMVDYVVTNTLSLTTLIGLADFLRESALSDLLDNE